MCAEFYHPLPDYFTLNKSLTQSDGPLHNLTNPFQLTQDVSFALSMGGKTEILEFSCDVLTSSRLRELTF